MKMSKEEFMKKYREDMDKKKRKKNQKERDYYAVKEMGYRKSRFKIGEI